MKRIILIITTWLFIPLSALAGSTAVSAPRFIVRAAPGEIISRDLVVSNLSSASQSQQYHLSLDDGNARLASFIPADFNLSPNQSQRVLLRFRQPERSQQKQLAILSYDGGQSGDLKIASGIKIPVYFIVPPLFVIASRGRSQPKVGRPLAGNPELTRNTSLYVFAVDFALLFIVCLLWQRRIFWRRRRLRHKINFV